jgi:hypothetical protein
MTACFAYGKTQLPKLERFSDKTCKDASNPHDAAEKNPWFKQIEIDRTFNDSEGKEQMAGDKAFLFKPTSLTGVSDKSLIVVGDTIQFYPMQDDNQETGLTKIDCKKKIITFWATDSSGDTTSKTTFSLRNGKQLSEKQECNFGCE